MANELLKKYLGKNCCISTGSFGSNVIGTITTIEDNWLEITTKKGVARLINADFITNIEVLSK